MRSFIAPLLGAAVAVQFSILPLSGETPVGLVALFEKTCLRGFPDFDIVHNEARKLGFERLSETQSAANGTRQNVSTYVYRGKKHCVVDARGVDPVATAQAFTSAMSRYNATKLRLKSNGRVGQANVTIAGRKATALSQLNLASTRISGTKITLKH